MFHGSLVALITPFKNGEVDYRRLAEQIEFQIAGGTDGLVPCGTTGESPTLSHEEHEQVVSFVVERARKRVPVVAGAGSNSTREALRLAKHAASAGADATLQVNPYYNKPTQEGLYRHFKTIADQVDLPVVLYNIPGRCGVALTSETIARLRRDSRNIVAVKEATGSLDTASEIASLCDITILSGDDSLTLPLGAVGGKGVISVVANVVPADVKALTAAMLAGNFGAALALHGKLFPLCRAMFIETNPIPVKAALAALGMDTGELRLPMCELRPENRKKLLEAMKDYGLKPGKTAE
jgi:4-hydroxy-tetrahydrodipicolinate synthase